MSFCDYCKRNGHAPGCASCQVERLTADLARVTAERDAARSKVIDLETLADARVDALWHQRDGARAKAEGLELDVMRLKDRMQVRKDCLLAESKAAEEHKARAEALAKALEFYADEKNYEEREYTVNAVQPWQYSSSKVGEDEGQLARAALAAGRGPE